MGKTDTTNTSTTPTAPSNPMEPELGSIEYQLKKYLLILSTLVATVTYAVGLNLPGGVWEDTQEGHHLAGDVILRDTHYRRYLMFYYCNATSFVASVVVCLLLLPLERKGNAYLLAALQVVMLLDLLGLMGAYAAGTCRDTFTIIYTSLIMSAIFAYIVPSFFYYVRSKYLENVKQVIHSFFCYVRYKYFKNEKQGETSGKEESGPMKKEDCHKREDQHEELMLLATFAITITFVAGLNPPGGFWSDGDRVSDPILKDSNPSRYQAFFVCNTTSFVASLLVVLLLLDSKMRLKTSDARYVALYGFIVIALFGLAGAYAAGSCRELDATAYVISLIGLVLAYIFLQVAWLKCNNNGDRDNQPPKKTTNNKAEELEKTSNLVILLATLAASITYQAGLDPPGGLWPDDQEGHHMSGNPVLLTTHPMRYKVFYYSNSAAFVTSLVVIIMVQSRLLLRRPTLVAAMLLDLFGLIGAYAAGSCRDVSTSIYVVALAGVVLIYVVIHIVFFTLEDHNHKDDPLLQSQLENKREVLLLLAILLASLTYQAGLTPPGGFWSANDASGHYAGFPVLQDSYPQRYKAFFYCNAMSFMASISLIVLLVNPNLYRTGIRCYALYVCMVAGMFGLLGAYAAGSSRHLRTSIYVLTLVAAVFTSVILAAVWTAYQKGKKVGCNGTPSGQQEGTTGSDIESSRTRGEDLCLKAITLQGIICFWTRGQRKRKKVGCSDIPSKQPEGIDEPGIDSKEEKRDKKNLREYLMLLGVLAASVTYQSGLKPPGGLWQDNDGHIAGNSILHDTNRHRYHAFFYSNSTSFMASIIVVVLLLPKTLHSDKLPRWLWPMHTAILLSMLGLLGGYAAGSTTDWNTSRNVICLVIPVLLYIAAWTFLRKEMPKNEETKEMPKNEETTTLPTSKEENKSVV